MDTRHLPASSSPRSWRTRCGCLECGSRVYPEGRRHRTTRSSLCARGLRPGLPSAPATWRGCGAQPLHACPRRFPASVSPSAQWEVPHLPHRYLAVSGPQFPNMLGGKIMAVLHQSQWLASGLDVNLPICLTDRHVPSPPLGTVGQGTQGGPPSGNRTLSTPLLVGLRTDLVAPGFSL